MTEDTHDGVDAVGEATLEVEDIGGVSHATVTISEGVTLLAGANASNKSSLLRALAGVLGGPLPPVRSDAETGRVELSIDGTTSRLELGREDGETVVRDAEPYSTASDRCELFVALTELNPIRQAIVAGDELYDLLMRPVDTERLDAEISRLDAEKTRLDDRLAELDAMADRRPALEARRNSLEGDLEDIEAELRAQRDRVTKLETERDDEDEEASALREKQTERTEVANEIRTQEDAIDSLETELEEVDAQLADASVDETEHDVEALEAKLDRLHTRKQELTSTINALSPIVEMNAQLLDDGADVPTEMTSADVVAELDPDTRTITCWTCGSTVERAEIAKQVETIQAIVREKRAERDSLTERIGSLTEQKRELARRREDLEQLRERRAELATELEDRQTTLAELKTERRRLERDIEELQATGDQSETDAALAESYDRISELEYERGRVATDIERVDAELRDIEDTLADRDDLEQRRERVTEQLRDRRERVQRIERELVTTFNETMQDVLDALAYESIERVWLERRSTGDGVDGTAFDLHVVREGEDGVYDDTVDTLSKSEREVVGLIVALAGYLAHDVSEEVPFLVVDAVEMFDADRIRGLLERFAEHADYVIAAVLPEERAELDGTYDTVSTSSLAVDSCS